jgi:hypothetical protein
MARCIAVEALAWAPPEWSCCGFPLEAQGCETVVLDTALAVLHDLADGITEADSTALGPAMHVAHMLVSRQGPDGKWPAILNARTGEYIGPQRTDAPVRLYRRLADILQTTEFDHVIEHADQQTT